MVSQNLGSSQSTPKQVILLNQSQSTSELDLDISGLVTSDYDSPCSDRDVHFECSRSACSSHVASQSDLTRSTIK